MKFRKNQIVIEAIKFDEKNGQEIIKFMECQYLYLENGFLVIETLEGVHYVTPGDWIIKGIKGEFYPCKSDIFEATYEEIRDESK